MKYRVGMGRTNNGSGRNSPDRPMRSSRHRRLLFSYCFVFIYLLIFNDSRQTNCLKIFQTDLRRIFRVGILYNYGCG